MALRKDSESFLEIALQIRKETGKDNICCSEDVFKEIPNFHLLKKELLDDLKKHNCISNRSDFDITGDVRIIFTLNGINYFNAKKEEMKNETNIINNFYASVNNTQIQQNTTNSSQQQTNGHELDYAEIAQIVKTIKINNSDPDEAYKEHSSEIELQKKKSPGRIRDLLCDIRDILTSTGNGNIITTLSELINKVL